MDESREIPKSMLEIVSGDKKDNSPPEVDKDEEIKISSDKEVEDLFDDIDNDAELDEWWLDVDLEDLEELEDIIQEEEVFKIKKVLEAILNKVDVGLDKGLDWVEIAWKGSKNVVGKFFKKIGETGKTFWDKDKSKAIKTIVLTSMVLATLIWIGHSVADSGLIEAMDNDNDESPDYDPSLEPNHDYYNSIAQERWQSFRGGNWIEGGMMDPMAINNSETQMLTGFIPGWFCAPETVSLCEEMLGVDLESQVPEGKQEADLFFREMRLEWDEEWQKVLEQNPNLPQEVKDFYSLENREKLRTEYEEKYPINSTSFKALQKTVADEMFVGMLKRGEIVPRDVNLLTYSPLLGEFAAMVLVGKFPLFFQMKDNEFVYNEELKVKPSIQEARKKFKEITEKKDYTFMELQHSLAVLNKELEEEERNRGLKDKSLGRY